MDHKEELLILLNVIIASVLSGMVGFEREKAHKPAGFRTHMIIGGAAALLVSLGEIMVRNFTNLSYPPNVLQTDPLRIIEAIIVGISFIGAGTILKGREEDKVYYLTSAATILFSAGIGISVALKKYILAIGLTLLIIIINYLVKSIKTHLIKEGK